MSVFFYKPLSIQNQVSRPAMQDYILSSNEASLIFWGQNHIILHLQDKWDQLEKVSNRCMGSERIWFGKRRQVSR